MKRDLGRNRICLSLALVLSSSVVLFGTPSPTRASEFPQRIVVATQDAFRSETQDLAKYAKATDAATRLTYARLLAKGLMQSPTNPLRGPKFDAAIDVYRGLLSSGDEEIRLKAVRELADLLVRKGGAENLQEAETLKLSVEKPSDLPNAAQQGEVNVVENLRNGMANGSLDAAFDLLLLQARENPAEVDTLRSQMMLMANLSALDGDSAVIRLAGRYAGSFDAQAHPDTLKALLLLAAGGGSDSMVGILDKQREVLISILGKDQVREIVWRLVEGGSSRAAELVALDLIDENVFGFDEADGKWAIQALEDVGSYRANYVTAKLYYQGIYVERDLPRAIVAMDKMLAGADAAGQEMRVVADRFARMNLSDALIAKYAIPLYMSVWQAGDTSVVARLARAIVSAEKSGYYATSGEMPLPPSDLEIALSDAYSAGDLAAGMMLADIYREGRLVAANPSRAREIYQDLQAQYTDRPEMQLKLREQLAKLVRQDLEATQAYAPYYAEVRSLAEQNNLWAMRELGLLLTKGAPQLQADPAKGFDLLLSALSNGYFVAGPDAASFAFASGSAEDLQKIADAYVKFDPRILTPESKVQLAEVDYALEHFDQAEELLKSSDVLDLAVGRFQLVRVQLAKGELSPALATEAMAKEIVAFHGDDSVLLKFIQELGAQPDVSAEIMEPVLARLAAMADNGNLNAIASAFKFRQRWPASKELNFRNVVEWTSILAEKGESAPLARVATNVNLKTVGDDNYRYLVDKVEAVLPNVPTNGNLRMFLAREYMKGRFRPKDFDKAKQFIRQAAEFGNEEALNNIATDYYYGQDVALDRDRAEALYRDLAFMGSNRSALALARSYSKGPSSRVYETRAFAYYIKAALNGSVTAMTELGRSYLAGAGVALDEAKGVQWLEKAAAAGNADAMTQLYYYYFIKNPTNQNPEAETWLNALVETEVPDMIVRKAVLLHERDPVGNRSEIFALLEHAEGLGSQFARRLKNAYTKQERDGGNK